VIKSQWVLVTPAGSLLVVWSWARTKGGPSIALRVQPLASGLAWQV